MRVTRNDRGMTYAFEKGIQWCWPYNKVAILEPYGYGEQKVYVGSDSHKEKFLFVFSSRSVER